MTEDQVAEEPQPIAIPDQIRNASPDLHPTTLDVLADMYGACELYGTESDEPISIGLNTRIGIGQGATINRLMRDHSVERSLEIGFAYGFSTVWMLDALMTQTNTRHVAIDPFEKSSWKGIGIAQRKRLPFRGEFKWIKNYSIHALSYLIENNEKFEFIFIDGNHRFDDVIVDFYLSDQLLRPGGLIVLDDMWLNSIRTAADFIVNNRAYEPVPQPFETIIVLRKTRDDDRDWRHFNNFQVHGFPPISEPPAQET